VCVDTDAMLVIVLNTATVQASTALASTQQHKAPTMTIPHSPQFATKARSYTRGGSAPTTEDLEVAEAKAQQFR
jgi:hypothetical protein